MRGQTLALMVLLALGGCVSATVREIPADAPLAMSDDVAERFELLRKDAAALAHFMRAFPKGGDIHHHLIGAPTPEMLIDEGIQRGFCLEPTTLAAGPGPCMGSSRPMAKVVDEPAQRERLIDLWSMRGFGPGDDRAAEHFFGIFPRIWPVVADRGALLARLMIVAQAENVAYLETQLQVPAPTDRLRALALAAPATRDVLALRAHLMADDRFEQIVAEARTGLQEYVATAQSRLGCAGPQPHAACGVHTRFQIYALRILPLPMVMADMILAYELAARSDEVVAVNIVGYEGDAVALADYAVHMQAMRALSGVFPQVLVAPHAGELTPREAGPAALGNHVPQAVYVAGARRVGHGVSVARSDNRAQLLRDLAERQGTIEICLTSNELLLGVAGDEHPLRMLWEAGVPTVLATDDAGIFRTDLSNEFALAAARYDWLSYADFKTLARRSIDRSFLPGDGLWDDRDMTRPVSACARLETTLCNDFLRDNRRAAIAAQLERQFALFEARVLAGELSP